jgi:hypothetical protein
MYKSQYRNTSNMKKQDSMSPPNSTITQLGDWKIVKYMKSQTMNWKEWSMKLKRTHKHLNEVKENTNKQMNKFKQHKLTAEWNK